MRMMVCSLCDGKRADERGHRCIECNGEGGFLYGSSRPLDEVIEEIEKTVAILDQDKAELARAKEALRGAKKEHRGQYHKQVSMCGESVDYWESRINILNREYLEAQGRPENANRRHGEERHRDDESFSLRA